MLIRRLVSSDARAYQTLRLAALCECPSAFGSSYEEECDTPLALMAERLAPESGHIVFGAFDEAQLVGNIGVGRETARKLAHKGFVRGMYVAPDFRNQGIGRKLMTQALRFAVSMHGLRQLTLSVNATNAGALALYEAMGFKSFGVEPAALFIDSELHDEIHMLRFIYDEEF